MQGVLRYEFNRKKRSFGSAFSFCQVVIYRFVRLSFTVRGCGFFRAAIAKKLGDDGREDDDHRTEEDGERKAFLNDEGEDNGDDGVKVADDGDSLSL